ncbi:MAG: HAD hydrolase-like protein [bacterium]
MKHKRPVVIFDFDGTIADSFDYVADFLITQASEEVQKNIKKESLRHLSMLAMARSLGFSNWQLPLVYLRGRRRMHKAIKNLQPYQGISELLHELHSNNYLIFVLSSNNRKNINAFLRHNNLRGLFTKIYGSVGVFGKAPAMRRLLKANKVAFEDAVYIGDELRDVEAAQYLGLPIIAVNWGFARPEDLINQKPTFIAKKPSELLSLIKKI